jgi:predicted ribosome quality control (RQC) complex YloA/Tae2 family protein
MNLDYFFIEALAAQLYSRLRGALVKKIHQPRADLLIIHLWNGRTEQPLELSIANGAVYLCLTSSKYRNPMQPPRFCQLLRAHLHRLTHISMLGFDRRVGLFFESREGVPKCLVLDLFGRHANMLLYAADNHVVDQLRRSVNPPQAGSLLPFAAGQAYASGECAHKSEHLVTSQDSEKICLADLSQQLEGIDQESAFSGNVDAAWLQRHVFPMSKAVARNLETDIYHAGTLDPVQNFAHAWGSGTLIPCLAGKVLSMCAPALQGADASEHADDLNRFLLDQLQLLNTHAPSYSADPSLIALVAKAQKKLRKRRANIETELEVCQRYEEYQHRAELLDAHRYLLQRGMEEVTVQNYYIDPPAEVVIALDPSKNPQEQIERAYNRARKARRGLEHCERRLMETAREQTWLDEVASQLRYVDSAADEEVIRAELMEHGYLRPGKKTRMRKRHINPADLVRKGVTPGGFHLLWGRNSRTNAYLSRQILKGEDLWFHAHNAPGCHLVLKTEGREAPDADIRIAAAIAAYYSNLQLETKAQVMWTHGKHVKQPKGARPGMVNVITYATLNVAPQDERALDSTTEDSEDKTRG